MMRVEIGRETIEQAMRSIQTRAALEAKARKVQQRAEQLAESERVDLSSEVSSGTRPKGRPYSRVESANIEQEWGSSKTARRRILGRAAESS